MKWNETNNRHEFTFNFYSLELFAEQNFQRSGHGICLLQKWKIILFWRSFFFATRPLSSWITFLRWEKLRWAWRWSLEIWASHNCPPSNTYIIVSWTKMKANKTMMSHFHVPCPNPEQSKTGCTNWIATENMQERTYIQFYCLLTSWALPLVVLVAAIVKVIEHWGVERLVSGSAELHYQALCSSKM